MNNSDNSQSILDGTNSNIRMFTNISFSSIFNIFDGLRNFTFVAIAIYQNCDSSVSFQKNRVECSNKKTQKERYNGG